MEQLAQQPSVTLHRNLHYAVQQSENKNLIFSQLHIDVI